MRTASRRARVWRATLVAVLATVPVLAAGCGGGEARTSNLRPPSPINVSVKIGEDRISASPTSFGAGELVMIASNQSSASQELTIDGPRVRQSVGPINPHDTATLKVTVKPGDYTLSAGESTAVKPQRLRVGPKRPSAQNELLQP